MNENLFVDLDGEVLSFVRVLSPRIQVFGQDRICTLGICCAATSGPFPHRVHQDPITLLRTTQYLAKRFF